MCLTDVAVGQLLQEVAERTEVGGNLVLYLLTAAPADCRVAHHGGADGVLPERLGGGVVLHE
eukprot:2531452-Prymnesium_polylepis.1